MNKNIDEMIFSVTEKKEFFNSLYFQYKSGVPILDILKTIKTSTKNEKIGMLCNLLLKKLEKGASLRQAFTEYQNILGKAYSMLICAGDETGKLEEILENILKNIKNEEKIKSSVISSLAYPICILILAIAVGLFFKFFVLKMFSSMSDGEIINSVPLLLLLAILKIALIFTVLAIVIFFIIKNDNYKRKFTDFIYGLKIFSKPIKEYYFQNFFTILALSYNSGIPITETINLANSVIKIQNINLKIKKSIKEISNGLEITPALKNTGIFSDFAISQISAGEKSGELGKMFIYIAQDYEQKLETSIKVIIRLIEPIMILIVGIMVLIIAVNAYTKYYDGIFSML